MTTQSVSAVILAAGLSSRMGDGLKPLLPLGDTTILGHCISLFQSVGIEDVLVVVGHQHEDLVPLVVSQHATPVYNPEYRRGMFSSVVAGLSSLDAAATAAFVLPVDIPLVRPQTIEILLGMHQRHRNRIIRPVYRGRRGHPPLIPNCFVESIVRWSGPKGLRGALDQFREETIQADVMDAYICSDIDTPRDYRLLRSKWPGTVD